MTPTNYHDLPAMCPKCGFIGHEPRRLSVWSDPRYREFARSFGQDVSIGHLEFRCVQCEYVLTRPTVDERPAAEPNIPDRRPDVIPR